MLRKKFPTFTWFVLESAWACLSVAHPTVAQIVPDATLPVNSIVTPQGNTYPIEGGTKAGSNLFHSFNEFSLPTGTEAFFNNAIEIQNIFARVTGSSISNLDGIIRANGTANLFLINPNGIIFGPNARLNIGGSFLASTASSIKFGERIEFSASNPNASALLTLNVPIGLQFGSNPGAIEVNGPGHNIRVNPQTEGFIRENRPLGLAIPDRTLALVGEEIFLVGGNITASSGRIALGSVEGGSLVTLTPLSPINGGGGGFQLSYENVPNFRDISLVQAASIDGSGSRGGDIQVQGRRVTLRDGSIIEASTLGSKPGGNAIVNASEAVELIGTSTNGQVRSGLFVNTYSTGTGGHLTINTVSVLVQNGAVASASTFGTGKAGNLTVNASEQVQLIGRLDPAIVLTRFPSAIGSRAAPGSTGDAGNLTINTRRLIVQNFARVGARGQGNGNAGIVNINASSILLDNEGFISTDSRSINTTPNQEQSTINLRSGTLILGRTSRVSTNAQGSNAIGGNINVESDVITALDDSRISANSQSSRGGQVRINTQAIISSSNSAITATGGTPDLSGSVEINSPNVNPNPEFGQLAVNLVDNSALIAFSCYRRRGNISQFVVTGRGGLPVTPYDAAIGRYNLTGVRSLPARVRVEIVRHNSRSELNIQNTQIVEASGWTIAPDGKVILTSSPPEMASNSPVLTPSFCHKSF